MTSICLPGGIYIHAMPPAILIDYLVHIPLEGYDEVYVCLSQHIHTTTSSEPTYTYMPHFAKGLGICVYPLPAACLHTANLSAASSQ